MSGGVSVSKIAARLGGALVCLAFVLPFAYAAQGRARSDGLPRVGTIKDYPATGLTVGCGNIYSHLTHEAKSVGAAYVFISNSDGGNAWMNLGGRDVRLRQIKPAARTRRNSRHLYYRLGSLSVTVRFADLKPDEPPFDEDFMFKLRITLRRGRAARTVRAVGYSDC